MLVLLIENGAFSTGHKFIYNRIAKRVLIATLMKKQKVAVTSGLYLFN